MIGDISGWPDPPIPTRPVTAAPVADLGLIVMAVVFGGGLLRLERVLQALLAARRIAATNSSGTWIPRPKTPSLTKSTMLTGGVSWSSNSRK